MTDCTLLLANKSEGFTLVLPPPCGEAHDCKQSAARVGGGKVTVGWIHKSNSNSLPPPVLSRSALITYKARAAGRSPSFGPPQGGGLLLSPHPELVEGLVALVAAPPSFDRLRMRQLYQKTCINIHSPISERCYRQAKQILLICSLRIKRTTVRADNQKDPMCWAIQPSRGE